MNGLSKAEALFLHPSIALSVFTGLPSLPLTEPVPRSMVENNYLISLFV